MLATVFIMNVLNYKELPESIKKLFKEKVISELIKSHKKIGIDEPKEWQIENALEQQSNKCLFHNDGGNYYFFKLEKLGYSNGG